MQFFNYTQKFPNLKYSENISAEDLAEVFKSKRTRIQTIRNELKNIKELNDVEIVQIWNLAPENKDEALSWIPSLERLIVEGKENAIIKAIEVIKRYKNMD